MSKMIQGLHHITALCGDAARNLDFYAGVLGLRLIKKTINFDAPDVYHLYYGDESGQPGTILTFFPIPGIKPGRKGTGQLTVTSFSVAEDSLEYWMKRFDRFDIPYKPVQKRFDDEVFIYFEDYEGLGLELVANGLDDRKGFTGGHIPPEFAVKGFHGITIQSERPERTAALLTEKLDHKVITGKGSRFRYSASERNSGFVDIITPTGDIRGLSGSGTVHHVAFATQSDETQEEVRKKIHAHGLNVTPRIDRQYFHSIYFREPGGVLFEVATSDIGFELDETLDHLGEELKLPPWMEFNRNAIENGLQPVTLNTEIYQD